MTTWLQAENFIEMRLASGLAQSATTMTVETGEGAELEGHLPCRLVIGSEVVTATERTDDTVTITRGAEGTADVAHYAGDAVTASPTWGYVEQLQERIDLLERVLALAWGGGDGVIREAPESASFEVIAQGTPDMTVEVTAGYAVISGRIEILEANYTTAAISAPTGGAPGDLRRIDLVELTLDVGVQIVTGTESATPSAPSVDADSISIGLINCRNGMASIKDEDDSSNGYITDPRTFV